MHPEQRKLAIVYMGHEVLHDCAITISLEYSNLWVNPLPKICYCYNCILQTLGSVMIWVTTFLVCLEVMMHYQWRILRNSGRGVQPLVREARSQIFGLPRPLLVMLEVKKN